MFSADLGRVGRIVHVPVVQRGQITACCDARPLVWVHGVEVEYGTGHVTLLRFPRLPRASRSLRPIVAVRWLVAGRRVGVPVYAIPLGLIVVDLCEGGIATCTVGAAVRRAQDVDVTPHRL